MTNLRDRFQELDDLRVPDMWREIEGRAAIMPQRGTGTVRWVLVLAILLLTLAVGGAALMGSGVIKLPVSVEASPRQSSPAPSTTPDASPASAWTMTGAMNEPRSGQSAVRLRNGHVLVMGGIGDLPGGHETASAELYDPETGSWTTTGSMTQSRKPGHTATLLQDGRVLVVGWEPWGDLYDPTTGRWTNTRFLIESRGGHTATLLEDGRVLVAGPGATAELYDPATGTWTATGSMAGARGDHAASLLPDGTVLVVGGFGDSGPVDSAERYDPATETWTAAGTIGLVLGGILSPHRGDVTVTLLDDGRVLVLGPGPRPAIYQPTTGTWTATSPLPEAFDKHTATLLDDGRVLLVSYDGTAALFDPTGDTWTQVGSMVQALAGGGHSATLLNDGRVLVVGGPFNPIPNVPAEIFDPTIGN